METLLKAELKLRKPLRNVEERVVLDALRTADHLLRAETQLLKAVGLSFAQYNVLRILRGAEPNGLTCGAIAERMVNRDPDITRLLDRLEARRLVGRSRDQDDRRVIVTRITATGLKLLGQLDDPVDRVHREQLAHMSRKQLQTLAELLELARHPGS
jgi:MarR family transcriptional regulator, organic hydroperoxide resistance regulator